MLPNQSFYNFANWGKKKDYMILACAVVLHLHFYKSGSLNCESDTRCKIFNELLRQHGAIKMEQWESFSFIPSAYKYILIFFCVSPEDFVDIEKVAYTYCFIKWAELKTWDCLILSSVTAVHRVIYTPSDSPLKTGLSRHKSFWSLPGPEQNSSVQFNWKLKPQIQLKVLLLSQS